MHVTNAERSARSTVSIYNLSMRRSSTLTNGPNDYTWASITNVGLWIIVEQRYSRMPSQIVQFFKQR